LTRIGNWNVKLVLTCLKGDVGDAWVEVGRASVSRIINLVTVISLFTFRTAGASRPNIARLLTCAALSLRGCLGRLLLLLLLLVIGTTIVVVRIVVRTARREVGRSGWLGCLLSRLLLLGSGYFLSLLLLRLRGRFRWFGASRTTTVTSRITAIIASGITTAATRRIDEVFIAIGIDVPLRDVAFIVNEEAILNSVRWWFVYKVRATCVCATRVRASGRVASRGVASRGVTCGRIASRGVTCGRVASRGVGLLLLGSLLSGVCSFLFLFG
jgi:hypothetical protein